MLGHNLLVAEVELVYYYTIYIHDCCSKDNIESRRASFYDERLKLHSEVSLPMFSKRIFSAIQRLEQFDAHVTAALLLHIPKKKEEHVHFQEETERQRHRVKEFFKRRKTKFFLFIFFK